MHDSALALVLLVVGLPLAGALLAGLMRGRAGDAVAVTTALATAALAVVLVATRGMSGFTIRLGGLPAVDRAVGHPLPLFGFAVDPLASLVLLGAVVIGFACVLYSIDYVGPANREIPASPDRRAFWFWMLLFISAMSGLVLSATLVQMFLFWEVTTVCSWALIGYHDREPDAPAAARKAFLMTAGGGLALFAAVITLLALTHSAGFDAFARLGPAARGTATVLFVLILVGAWAKSGQVPFHTWLPSAMVAPSPVSAYLHAASMVNAGVYLVLRIVTANGAAPRSFAAAGEIAPVAAALPLPPALPGSLAVLVGVMAVVTIVVTVAQFFYQDDLKRLLALSTMSQLALVLLGAALGLAGSVRATQGAALHVLAHGVGKALLFLSVGALSYAAGTRRMRDLGGVFARAPIPAIGFLIGALTVTGVPPFAGFWSKLFIVTGAVSLGGIGPVAGGVVVLESVVAFVWFLWVGQAVFLGRMSPAAASLEARAPAIDVALVLLIVLCLGAGIAGLPLAAAVTPVASGG